MTMKSPDQDAPAVTVVIPTRDRPELLRRALDSVLEQDYPGALDVLVVYDNATPDRSLERDGTRPVRVLPNQRATGLAGTRNTGILAADGAYVAFLDDDDHWRSDKLRRQLTPELLASRPVLLTCSIEVDYDGKVTPRLAGTSAVTQSHLTRSRMSMLHSSTFVFDTARMTSDFGLVSEGIPGSQNEDWDLLLRAARLGPIRHVDEPLVTVQWGRTSFYSRAWDTKIDSSVWMLEQHPEVVADRRGAARVYGQIAFAEAARGRRKDAFAWVRKALRADPRQWRAVISVPVALGLVKAETILHVLHRFGRGV